MTCISRLKPRQICPACHPQSLGRGLLLRLLRSEIEAAGIGDPNRVITIDSTLG